MKRVRNICNDLLVSPKTLHIGIEILRAESDIALKFERENDWDEGTADYNELEINERDAL